MFHNQRILTRMELNIHNVDIRGKTQGLTTLILLQINEVLFSIQYCYICFGDHKSGTAINQEVAKMGFLLRFGSKYRVPPVSKGGLKYSNEQMHKVVSTVYGMSDIIQKLEGFSKSLWVTSRYYATHLGSPTSPLETSKSRLKES